jgi:glutamate N-acetyltransferase/amino-acid N-acetyltransferase
MANNGITAPRGFLAAGIKCGIKKSGRADLGLIVCPSGAKAAAVFTTNKITSAAVQVSKKHIKSKTIYAVVVNSGNANACTGQRGVKNAIRMCSETAGHLVVDPHEVLVASTGIIGEQLPMEKAITGIADAVGELSDSASAGLDFAKAIMTTDTKPKCACRRITLLGKKVTIAGTVKGAGMIAPNMATTLCFITTDAAITKPLLTKALKSAISGSLNKLTVDGHQSTNDTTIILTSGLAENKPITKIWAQYKKFAAALSQLATDLAKQMTLDAEGATRMFKVVVKGAATKADAAKAARAVANYDLVKCAIHGGDPNWGRIICAVGSSGVHLNLNKMSCKLDELVVFKNGSPTKFDLRKAGRIVSQTSHIITVDLGVGKYGDFCFGCDLSKGYVTINTEYHT